MHTSQYDIQSRAMLMHHSKSTGMIDLTCHEVYYQDDMFQVGAGRVLGAEEKAEIVAILRDEEAEAFTLRNPQVLAHSPYALAWWTPKGEREILFRQNNEVIRHTVMFPTMVGVYMRGVLYFAVTKSGKATPPRHDTPLFHIPLPNSYRSGMFCRGNAKVPAEAKEKHIPAWTSFVFDTTNTHLGEVIPLRNASNMASLIEAYAHAAMKGVFPMGDLMPMEKTLGQWLTSLDKGRRS